MVRAAVYGPKAQLGPSASPWSVQWLTASIIRSCAGDKRPPSSTGLVAPEADENQPLLRPTTGCPSHRLTIF